MPVLLPSRLPNSLNVRSYVCDAAWAGGNSGRQCAAVTIKRRGRNFLNRMPGCCLTFSRYLMIKPRGVATVSAVIQQLTVVPPILPISCPTGSHCVSSSDLSKSIKTSPQPGSRSRVDEPRRPVRRRAKPWNSSSIRGVQRSDLGLSSAQAWHGGNTRGWAAGDILNATHANLKAFRNHGGKLLMYHGWRSLCLDL